MRQVKIFSGSSHPGLVESVCDRVGVSPAKAELGKFANGETKVQLNTSIRNQDVFIVQSGSDKINDDVMELLIMISACKSGSAKTICAVIPYFPYSRQSKKKSHRGAITARMVANLLKVAGVTHVITIDLHASQMQGFFHCPIDNLFAEPLIANWIRMNVEDYKRAVVVSKNPGGTKRVTSLADALKLNFGIVMTDRQRPGNGIDSMMQSAILDPIMPRGLDGNSESIGTRAGEQVNGRGSSMPRLKIPAGHGSRPSPSPLHHSIILDRNDRPVEHTDSSSDVPSPASTIRGDDDGEAGDVDDAEDDDDAGSDSGDEGDFDPNNRGVITGRLVAGHIVDDDYPSPTMSATSRGSRVHSPEDDLESLPEAMLSSYMSTASSTRGGFKESLGGSGDAGASDDEEDQLINPDLESTVTLVGNVRDRPVIILDDMIDKPASWVAAAETVVKRGGATRVYCIATHGLFGEGCLEDMEACECIDAIIVTNSAAVSEEKLALSKKLVVLDVSNLLAEAIRRTHHGESISQLYMHY